MMTFRQLAPFLLLILFALTVIDSANDINGTNKLKKLRAPGNANPTKAARQNLEGELTSFSRFETTTLKVTKETKTDPPPPPSSSSIPTTTKSPATESPMMTSSSSSSTTKRPLKEDEIKDVCIDAYNTCFKPFSSPNDINSSSIALFCDRSFYRGNSCMMDATTNVTFKPPNATKPFYSFLECTRLLLNNSNAEPLKRHSWNFLSYCISNSPTNSSNPAYFKQIATNCTNPSSTKCTTASIEYVFNEPDYSNSDPDDVTPNPSFSPKIVISIFDLLISLLL